LIVIDTSLPVFRGLPRRRSDVLDFNKKTASGILCRTRFQSVRKTPLAQTLETKERLRKKAVTSLQQTLSIIIVIAARPVHDIPSAVDCGISYHACGHLCNYRAASSRARIRSGNRMTVSHRASPYRKLAVISTSTGSPNKVEK